MFYQINQVTLNMHECVLRYHIATDLRTMYTQVKYFVLEKVYIFHVYYMFIIIDKCYSHT